MHSINIYWVRNYLKTNELFWVDPFWNCGQTIWNKIIKGRQNVSLKFHHSPYLWHSSGDNVFTPVSYPLTLWSCLSHITSLLPLYPGKKNWIVTSLSIPEDNFWGLRVIQWIFFKGLVGWVTVPSSKFSRHINQKWPLCDIHNIEEFFYICFHCFLSPFFRLGCYQNKQKTKQTNKARLQNTHSDFYTNLEGFFPHVTIFGHTLLIL